MRDSVMFWAGIVGSKIMHTFDFDDRVKMNAEFQCKFLDKMFFEHYEFEPRSFKLKYIVV